MTKKEIGSALQIQSNNQEKLYQRWLAEIKENPHFKEDALAHDDNLQSYSKQFIEKMLFILSKSTLPNLPDEGLSGLFELWNTLKASWASQGMSAKSSALLIFSLKSALSKSQGDIFDSTTEKNQTQLNHILDFFGLLSFELYTAQQEGLIGRQSKQIAYLQNNSAYGVLIGQSSAMQVVYKAIGLILENDMTVLLQGESGTGKDIIASVIHQHSKRKKGPFITLNCGAIPKDLLESELFGHEKGSFTGADQQRLGKFELADGGTLFLDEIAEMSLELQVKLLRVLQNREIERVGGSKNIPINVRVIAATHQNLEEAIKQNRFREDLFYRLNVFPIYIPPLRDREQDILLLAQHFISHYAKQFQVPASMLSNDAEAYLLKNPWKGNVRELQNSIQRALVIANGQIITASHLSYKPGLTPPVLSQMPLKQLQSPKKLKTLDEIESEAISHTLQIKKGNIKQSAEALGISRATLYKKAQKYNLDLKNPLNL